MIAFLLGSTLPSSSSKEIIDEMAVSVLVNSLELNDSYLSYPNPWG